MRKKRFDTMEDDLVLLNDGYQSNEEGHCNSWPGPAQYPLQWTLPPCYDEVNHFPYCGDDPRQDSLLTNL